MLIAFAVVLTIPYWMFPVVYFLLRTLLVAPSGAFIWVLIFVLTGYIVWAWGTWIVQLVRRVKVQKGLRKRALEGDEAAAQEHLALRLSGLITWRHTTAFIGMQVLIAPAVALTLWHGMIESPGIIKDHGHVRRATPREELIVNLKAWQRRGIYRALGSED
jgi:hypothetical protein